MAAGYLMGEPRPATTRRFRRCPLGWTAPQAAEIASVPVRTVQHWRTHRMFVSAFPLGAEEGFKPGGLYALGDVVGLRFFRDLLGLKVDRALAARLARVVQVISPGPEGEFWAYRDIARRDPPWWWFFPAVKDLADEMPEGELFRFWDESMLAKRGLLGDDQRPATDALPYGDSEGDPVAYWYPVGAVLVEIIGKADSWRRRHRVSVRDWPPWM
jgi:hypothetical protein